MKTALLSRTLIATLGFACSGSGDHASAPDGGVEEPRAHEDESTLPPDLIKTSVRTLDADAGAGDVLRSGKDLECIEPAEVCDGTKSDCRSGQPDDLDGPSGGGFFGSTWSFISETAKETGQFFSNTVDGIANGFGTKGVDLTAYNAVPGYRLKFECEEDSGSRDYVQRGAFASPMGVHQCDLRANLVSTRKIRFIVERESDGHRVWQNMITIRPSLGTTSDTGEIEKGKSGTEIQVPLESSLTLHAAFYSTGWAKKGKADNRNQGALYLTYDRSRWMAEGMPQRLFRDQPLRQWVLPGSHDAGMYTHGALTDNLAMTQGQTLAGQLDAGMRYFDLRIGVDVACASASATRSSIAKMAAVGEVSFRLRATANCSRMAHGLSGGGAAFVPMVDDVIDFLTRRDNKEIVVLHFTTPTGIRADLVAAPTDAVAQWVEEAALARGLSRTFVRVIDGKDKVEDNKKHDKDKAPLDLSAFDKSPQQLFDEGTRILVISGGGSSNSWNEADYEALNIAPNLVHTADRCLKDRGTTRWLGSTIQLQGTPTIGAIVSQSVQGNKLVFDRDFYPWLARGNAADCKFGPTFVINDYVDNALTDSIMRGAVLDHRRVPREQFAFDDSNVPLPASVTWLPGELTWHSRPVVMATKGHVLTLQEDGNVVLYRTGRRSNGDDPGPVCKREPIWATDTVGRGAYFDFQSNGDLVVHSREGGVVWKSGPGGSLVLQEDGNLVLYSTPDGRGKSVWSSQTAGKGTPLSCP